MTKKFNIHDWQVKHLFEQVQIKKVVDQSMNNDDIGKLQDVIRNNDLGKVLNTIAVILDRTGGAPEGSAQMIADLVPYIDLADPTVTPEDEEFTPDLEDDELKRGAIQQMMAKEKGIGEQNVTGTGASFNAGAGMGHFGKSKKKRKNTSSGDMAYTQKVNEEEYTKDVEKLETIINSTINTKDEWKDMFQLLMAHSEEVSGLSDNLIKSLLQQSLKDI